MANMPPEIVDEFQGQEDGIDRLLIDTRDEFTKAVKRTSNDWDRFDKIIPIIIGAFAIGLLSIVKGNDDLIDTILKVNEKQDYKFLSSLGKEGKVYFKELQSGLRSTADDFKTNFIKQKSYGSTVEKRIKLLQAGATKTVRNIVEVGVKSGKSAVDIARDIEQYVRPDERLLRVSPLEWYRQRFASYKVSALNQIPAGSISYNAFLIARTESNRIYRNLLIESYRNEPFVYGFKWNLSAGHPKPDICDVWAEQDNGMGPGVYDDGNLPEDHPNGLCFVTKVLISKEEMFRYLKTDKMPEKGKFTGETVTTEDWLKAKKGVSETDAIRKFL